MWKRRPSRWDLRIKSCSSEFTETEEHFKTELTVHKTCDNDAKDGCRIAFVYEIDDEDDLPEVAARCIARAKVNHKAGKLESAYFIQLPDSARYMEVIEDVLDEIAPDVTVVASRKVMHNINGTGDFANLDPLMLINRLHDVEWPSGEYPTIITLPDNDVFLRTNEGRLAKESATRVGEWVEAFTVALRRRNLYTVSMDDYSYEMVNTLDKFEDLLDLMYDAPVVSIDTETDNLKRLDNRLASIQFAFDGKHAYVLPIYHPESPFTSKQVAYILGEIAIYLETSKKSIHVYANAKFDLLQLRRETKYKWYNHDLWDVQGFRYLENENRKFRDVKLIRASSNKEVLSCWSLGQMAIEYGTAVYLSTAMGKDDRSRIFATPLKEVAEYGGVDVCVCYQIYEFQKREMSSRGKAYARTERIGTKQISSMIKAFVEMETNGLTIDRAYLTREVAQSGAFVVARKEALAEIYALEEVKEANRILMDRYMGGNMFDGMGNKQNSGWMFDINTVEHQQVLFFEVLKLQPVGVGKDGVTYSTNKLFKDTYAPRDDKGVLLEDLAVPAVALFRNYGELKHLFTTFLKAFYERLYSDSDMRDGCLRTDFMYLPIVSGRGGARKPSLHQIPSRSKLSKTIKRQFITRLGEIYLKGDYVAAEVKGWGTSAGEQNLAETFILALQKRKEFRLLDRIDDPKKWELIFNELDLHRRNCKLFYGVEPKDVSKEMRQGVKTVTFGTVYGMSAKRLAFALKITEEAAQDLIDTLFNVFPEGAAYIRNTHKTGQEYLAVVSSIGRVRHLWGYLHTDLGVQGAMDRRGPNSRIQSLSSDEGFEGNYQTQRLRWELFHKQDLPLDLLIRNAVHDSSENTTKIEHLPMSAYLVEHGYTTCVHKSYMENYGMEFNVGLEQDFEIGGSLATVGKWDFRPESMRKLVEDSIKWQQDTLGYKTSKETLRKFEENLIVMDDLRCEELRKLPANGVNMWMALTPKIAKQELVY